MDKIFTVILTLIGIAGIGGLLFGGILKAFFKQKRMSEADFTIKNIFRILKNYDEKKDEILDELEAKRNETKKMSNDKLVDDVNSKLNKRRNNRE